MSPEAGMSIERLAERSATTTRNIRNYQTLGLLPKPTMSGRVGLYGEGHLARLRLIDQLQEHGFALAGIGKLLAAWEEGRTLGDLLGFEAALTAPWIEELPELISIEDAVAAYPESIQEPALVARAIEVGLISFEGERVRVASPRLFQIGAQLARSGVPLAAILDELDTLRTELDAIATRFVAMFDRYQWQPFADAGMPAEAVGDVADALRRMRPLAQATVEVLLAQAMARRSADNTALRSALGFIRPDAPTRSEASASTSHVPLPAEPQRPGEYQSSTKERTA